MKITRTSLAGRTLLAGLCGAAAAVGGGASFALIYGVGYGLETGGTFTSPGGDMDFTGYASALVALPVGALAFAVFGSLLFRRAQVPRTGGLLPLAIMITLALASALVLHLPDSVPRALTGTLSAFLCFAALTLLLDRHTTVRWQLAAGTGLLAAMSPILAGLL